MAPTYKDEIELPDGGTHTVSAETVDELDVKTTDFLEDSDRDE